MCVCGIYKSDLHIRISVCVRVLLPAETQMRVEFAESKLKLRHSSWRTAGQLWQCKTFASAIPNRIQIHIQIQIQVLSPGAT